MDVPTSDIAAPTEPDRRVVVTALGLTQIFAWGSSYYLPAVLAGPIAADTGWPLFLVVGGASLGLLVAGLVSPRVGRAIDRRGGRPVLALGSTLLAAGLALQGLAHGLPLYLFAWGLMGAGMGCGLYDAAFGTLGRTYGETARGAITALTLWGGFASTVCWPLSAFLVEQLGWRGACFAYAALQLGFALPIHLLLLPRVRQAPLPGAAPADTAPPRKAAGHRRAFLLLALIVMLGGAASSLISVHLLTLLQERGLTLAAAVSLGVLVGPSQVGARLVEMALGRRYHPLWTLTASTGLIAAGLMLLLAGFSVVALALMLYGAGNGLWSIARGTVPLALFGPSGYAALMGRLAMPSLLAQALSPVAGALILEHGGAGPALALLAGLAAANVALAAALWGIRDRPAGPAREP